MRGRTIGALTFLSVVTLCFSMASMYVKPNEKDMLPIFGLAFPYIYVLTLLLIPFSFRDRKALFYIGGVLLFLGGSSFLSYVQPDLGRSSEGGDLHVISYNAMMGFKMVNRKHQFTAEKQEQIKDLLQKDPEPSIICVQEASPLVRRALHETFDSYHRHEIENRGALIISEHPILSRGQVDFGVKWKSCLWADILVGEEDTIRVYSIHLESNRLSPSSYDFLVSDEGRESREAIDGIKDLVLKYPLYAARRGDQAEKVKAHINQSPFPVIVCGDFNDPPMSYTYRTIKKNLTDTFRKTGSGFGTTWIGAVPMLRIDYIFASNKLNNTGFERMKSDLSDHYPVKASFSLN